MALEKARAAFETLTGGLKPQPLDGMSLYQLQGFVRAERIASVLRIDTHYGADGHVRYIGVVLDDFGPVAIPHEWFMQKGTRCQHGDWLVRTPNGPIECVTPEEFAARFVKVMPAATKARHEDLRRPMDPNTMDRIISQGQQERAAERERNANTVSRNTVRVTANEAARLLDRRVLNDTTHPVRRRTDRPLAARQGEDKTAPVAAPSRISSAQALALIPLLTEAVLENDAQGWAAMNAQQPESFDKEKDRSRAVRVAERLAAHMAGEKVVVR